MFEENKSLGALSGVENLSGWGCDTVWLSKTWTVQEHDAFMCVVELSCGSSNYRKYECVV
jgi:hypothetical protein